MNHLILLIDATHILCDKTISLQKLEHADRLLATFVENFESLYGASNFVFNIHLLQHLATCVRLIGPLFTYSNYCFEDHIGYLLSIHKGTTDVASQISEKYIMQKNMSRFLPFSTMANEFFEEINNHHKYAFSFKVKESIVIGKPKNASENERLFITRSLNLANDVKIDLYDSVLLHSKVYYETRSQKKRTLDSFVFNTKSKHFAEITSVFVVQNELYFSIYERFEIIQCQNNCDSIIYLKDREIPVQAIIESNFIGPKFALLHFENTIACAQFPNMFERN